MPTFTANQTAIVETTKAYLRETNPEEITPNVLLGAIQRLMATFKVRFTHDEEIAVLGELIRHYSVFIPA